MRFFRHAFLLIVSAYAVVAPCAHASSRLAVCPGPQNAQLPAGGSSTPGISEVQALILTARTVRDMPGNKKVGEEALARAESALRTLLSLSPKDSTLHALAGERDLLMVQYRGFPAGMVDGKKAQSENDRALLLGPDNAEAHLSRGIELYFKPWFVGGSVDKALREFERANALRPHDPRILSWIGVCRHRLGRSGARSALDAALALCPKSPLYLSRARTFNPRAVHP